MSIHISRIFVKNIVEKQDMKGLTDRYGQFSG